MNASLFCRTPSSRPQPNECGPILSAASAAAVAMLMGLIWAAREEADRAEIRAVSAAAAAAVTADDDDDDDDDDAAAAAGPDAASGVVTVVVAVAVAAAATHSRPLALIRRC